MFVVCRRLDSGESDESFVETSTNLGSIMDLFRVGVGVVANLVEYLIGPLGLGLKDSNGYVRMVAAIGAFKLYHISVATCVDADFPSMLKSLMLHDSDSQLQIVYLAFLQEIWSLEASSSEEASKEREVLLSKP
ncbi:hypothetical protein Syun_002247 [Stephania yunnanensis]|uniref:Condensin complex subunit 1 C-terminal domain-containing protein n=1 Tax=Stephania yunnanensis TaxID=152371 RepID=A0AAP0Q709_9MAGN